MKKTSSTTLKPILKKGENSKVEFKERATSLDKAMVAFANAKGGKIYIGITDEGEVKGVKITNKLKGQIQSVAENCDPEIPIFIKEFKKENVLEINIEKSKGQLHRCSSGFYIRKGATSQKLSTIKTRDLLIKADLENFDELPCEKFDYKKHFSKEKLFFFLDKAQVTYNRKNIVKILENLEVAKRQESKVIFNNAGALFFSKNLEKIFPNAEVSCGFFKGTDQSHVLDSERFNKDILSNIENAMKFLWSNLRARHEMIPKTARRRDVLEIPENALREALVNAMTHRNYFSTGSLILVEIYDDRVKISNSGGLHKELSKKDFGEISVTRNPLIARLMLRAKYSERMGTGIKKMKNLVKAEGLDPIKFEFSKFTKVTFFRKPLHTEMSTSAIKKTSGDVGNVGNVGNVGSKLEVKPERLSRLLKILVLIERKKFSTSLFSQSQGTTLRTVERDISLLKSHGLISTTGTTRTRKYKVTEKYKKLKKKL